MLAILYDIHGNLPALEAAIADAESAGADTWLLGGDFASWSPWPKETLERLRGLHPTTWIRGNGERWMRDLPLDRPEVVESIGQRDPGVGLDEGWLFSLQTQVELDGVLYVHGSPLSDVDSFAREPQDGEERLLAGEAGRTILFGHSHVQFRRPGPDETLLVNPGSVGMPLDGDPRAAWALHEDGEFELRRTDYDVERAAAQMRTYGEWAEPIVYRIEHGADAPQ